MSDGMKDGREWQFSLSVLGEAWVQNRFIEKAKAVARGDSRGVVCLVTRDSWDERAAPPATTPPSLETLDDDARQVLYANLWNLYDGAPPARATPPSEPTPDALAALQEMADGAEELVIVQRGPTLCEIFVEGKLRGRGKDIRRAIAGSQTAGRHNASEESNG